MGLFKAARAGKDDKKKYGYDIGNHGSIAIYTAIGDFSRVRETLAGKFSGVTAETAELDDGEPATESFALRLRDGSEMKFTVKTDQEYVGGQMVGMHNFFAQANCKNKKLHESVLAQIRVFNCIIGGVYTLSGNAADPITAGQIFDMMFQAAKDLNGLVFVPSMRLFDGDKRMVFSIEGKSDLDEYIPVANADFLDSGAGETQNDIARRERSVLLLESKGIPYITHLRATVSEPEARLRSPEEIAGRLLAMFAVCVYCEVRGSGGTWEEGQKQLERMDEILAGRLETCLTPEEKAFLPVKEPEQMDLARFGWRYECCYVLMWALGLFDELGYPDKICDVSAMAGIVWGQTDMEGLLEGAKIRPAGDVLDAADLLLRYDWACVDARIKNMKSPAGLNEEVVLEWHYAFNWLIGANDNADWDDVSTNT